VFHYKPGHFVPPDIPWSETMAKMLTMAGVQKMRPGDARIEVKDAGCKGLALTIEPSGLKRWSMRFRQADGSLLRLTLGPVDLSGAERDAEPQIGDPLSLASARRLATDVNRRRELGHDFRAAKERQKFERQASNSKTFEAAAKDFIQQHSMRKVRGWIGQGRSLGIRPAQDGTALESSPGGLAERWRNRPLDQIDGDDIHALVREVRERGVPGLGRKNMEPSEPRARTVFSDLSKFFAWCVEERRLKVSPVVGVSKPKPPKSRERTLSDREIRWLWRSCKRLPEPFGKCLQVLLLTGTRRSEVAEMGRGELEGSIWTLPSARSKNHRAHELSLPPMAMDILESVDTSGDLIFTTNNRTPISGWSKVKDKLDDEMLRLAREDAVAAGRDPDDVEIAPWVIHDLRRTTATKMAEIGIAPHVVEAVLNHVSGFRAGVGGVYNRASYGPEKKAALERWAAHLAGLVEGRPANVVPLLQVEA
jgi:integrase